MGEFLRHIPTSNPHKAACLVCARPTVQQSSSQRQTQHKVPAADLTCADMGIQRNWKLHHTINYNGCLHSSVRHLIPLPFQNLLFSYLSASDVSPVFSQPLSEVQEHTENIWCFYWPEHLGNLSRCKSKLHQNKSTSGNSSPYSLLLITHTHKKDTI